MKIKIGFWSFISSFICLGLFFIVTSSSEIVGLTTFLLCIHPLNIVFFMSLITFIFGLIGFSEATNWKLFFRSLLTVIITFCLSAAILYILVIGNLFKFT